MSIHDPHAGTRTFTFLGTGTSMGVPMLGCDCHVCTSANPKNHRFRCSVLIETPTGNILIDTTPELRLQLLRTNTKLIHAVLYTHYHVDHLFGLDDLRIFGHRLDRDVPLYCEEDVERMLRTAFSYAFGGPQVNAHHFAVPRLRFERIGPEPFELLGETVRPIRLWHGQLPVLGFRIGNVAYCTDVSHIPDGSWELLEGLDVLVIDALRPDRPHPSHFGVPQALEAIRRVKPRMAYFTHMAHTMEYEELMRTLPPGVEPAYDGLSFRF